jgi:hypothetical protein
VQKVIGTFMWFSVLGDFGDVVVDYVYNSLFREMKIDGSVGFLV